MQYYIIVDCHTFMLNVVVNHSLYNCGHNNFCGCYIITLVIALINYNPLLYHKYK